MLNQVTGETRVYNCYVHIVQTAWVTRRKVRATLGEYSLNTLGYTRAAMLHSKGRNTER